ncbi:uncharacterized protein LOC127050124 [Gopherus flavomarginatus]|uniref:uncharacterized protein LOC127050124 n=1 Tax=Gopherus flavomarginatus TaxID=286002 RepID=UPI0021CBEE7F|nr:uncharacterized protein LOC127050124 [Gopherus flavomarginatus]
MEGTFAANFSSLPALSRRLSQIRRRKQKTREEMFLEIMEVTRNERAHLNEWKDVVAKYRKDASDREDRRDQREDRRDAQDERRDARDERWRQKDQRWRDATLGLLSDQTDMLWRMVELQERQQDHRVPLQPLYHHLPPSPCSLASSPTRGVRISDKLTKSKIRLLIIHKQKKELNVSRMNNNKSRQLCQRQQRTVDMGAVRLILEFT